MKKIIIGIFVVLIILCFINQLTSADDPKLDDCDNVKYIGSSDTTWWFTEDYELIYWDDCLQAWVMPV